jgi:Pin2-interacting protein X1
VGGDMGAEPERALILFLFFLSTRKNFHRFGKPKSLFNECIMSNNQNDGPKNAIFGSSSLDIHHDNNNNNNNPTSIDLLVGSKMRKTFASSFREHVSAPVSEFAKSQLVKMGWTEGTGLGKHRDGRSTHIRVYKRLDSAGLGSEQSAGSAASTNKNPDDWWKDGLGDTLAKHSKKKKKKDAKYTYTDEELFIATGGARFGMRAGKTRNLAKWRRTESTLSNNSMMDDTAAHDPKSTTDTIISTTNINNSNINTEEISSSSSFNAPNTTDKSEEYQQDTKKRNNQDAELSQDSYCREKKRMKKEKKKLKKEKKRLKQEVGIAVC